MVGSDRYIAGEQGSAATDGRGSISAEQSLRHGAGKRSYAGPSRSLRYLFQNASTAFNRRRLSVMTQAVVVASDACPKFCCAISIGMPPGRLVRLEPDIVHGTRRELARHDAGDHRAQLLNDAPDACRAGGPHRDPVVVDDEASG